MAKAVTVDFGGLQVKQSVINSLQRVGLDLDSLKRLAERTDKVTAYNRFGGGSCETTPLVSALIQWVYKTGDELGFSMGQHSVKIQDFDRIKYWVLDLDNKAYMTCLD